MIIPMLCVTIFVILVVWFLLPRVARLMIHTPTAISIFVCFFFSSRRRHTRWPRDWSSDVCSSDLVGLRARRASSRNCSARLAAAVSPRKIGRASCRERVYVFEALTLADDRLEAFYDNPNALRDYFRDIGRMVLAAEGRKANDSHADCYQYFCVLFFFKQKTAYEMAT